MNASPSCKSFIFPSCKLKGHETCVIMNAYYTAIDTWFFRSFGKLLGFITFLSLCSVCHLSVFALCLCSCPHAFRKLLRFSITRNWAVFFPLSSFYLGDVLVHIFTCFCFYLYSVHVILGRFNLAAGIIWVYSNFFVSFQLNLIWRTACRPPSDLCC